MSCSFKFGEKLSRNTGSTRKSRRLKKRRVLTNTSRQGCLGWCQSQAGASSVGNSFRLCEKSGHVHGFPGWDTGTHLNLCFFSSTTILKDPLRRAWLRLWMSHLSFQTYVMSGRKARSAIAFAFLRMSPSWELLCDALSLATGAITSCLSRGGGETLPAEW